LVVGLVVFTIVRLIPGDPAAVILGPEATIQEVEELRTKMGLDEPLPKQLFNWFSQLCRGDLGSSLYYGLPVVTVIVQRLEPTLLLMVLGLFFAILIGIPAGIIAALKRNTFIDRIVMILAMLGVSTPNFWLGLNLIFFFAIKLKLFPATGYAPIAEVGLFGSLFYLILPGISIGLQNAADLGRLMRSSMLDVISSDYVRTARAKGVSEFFVIMKHALRNAMIPTLTAIGLAVARLAGGAVVTETVFNIPGAGRLVISSIMRRDYGVIQGHILLAALLYVVVNLMVDLIYKAIDPRVDHR